jgi:LacI family repressor for deo operon, udp, cdd, tsx, nupC, and nupG
MIGVTGSQPNPISRPGRATIEDVAAAAGVSVATVSRAIRGLPNVATSTRDRVQRIAAELSYRADPAASRLATGRSQAIGVAVPVLNGWYFSNVVAGVEAVCTEAGYDTVVLGISSAEQRARLIHDTDGIHRRIDGLVFVDVSYSDDELIGLADRNLHVVTIGARSSVFPSVGIDDVEVGRLATEHLIELGHRRIAVLTGLAEDPLAFPVPLRRLEGYGLAHRSAGLETDRSLEVVGNFSVAGGYEAVNELLALDEPPTAIFAMSDEMAFGAIQLARERGIQIPRDLSIVGVDDHELSVVVDLTTIHQDVEDHGARAARLLLDGLSTERPIPARLEDPLELVVRGTTGPPRTA